MGQDWSEIWLQKFSGTVTIWPKSVPSDFLHILSDPTPARLARMLHFGMLSTFPKILFIRNRLKLESAIMKGLQLSSPSGGRVLSPIISRRQQDHEQSEHPGNLTVHRMEESFPEESWAYKNKSHYTESEDSGASSSGETGRPQTPMRPLSDTRRGSLMEEFRRQSVVLFDRLPLNGDPDGAVVGR